MWGEDIVEESEQIEEDSDDEPQLGLVILLKNCQPIIFRKVGRKWCLNTMNVYKNYLLKNSLDKKKSHFLHNPDFVVKFEEISGMYVFKGDSP